MKITIPLLITLCAVLTGCISNAPTPVLYRQEVSFARQAFNLVDVDQPPTVISQARPVYPARFRKAGLQGSALTEFIVDEQGRVAEIHIRTASDAAFAASAKAAVSQWRFHPARKDGVAVACRLQVPVEFSIRD